MDLLVLARENWDLSLRHLLHVGSQRATSAPGNAAIAKVK